MSGNSYRQTERDHDRMAQSVKNGLRQGPARMPTGTARETRHKWPGTTGFGTPPLERLIDR